MPEPWRWDDKVKRYRDPTGKFISPKNMLSIRDQFLERRMGIVNGLGDDLATGKINVQQWVYNMRQEIKRAYLGEYELGVGGRNMMTQADYGRVGGQLKRQYEYLNNFAKEIQDGKLSQAQIQMRSRMYIDGATQSYERARSASMGMPLLPAYPGDGQTICRSNCKCNWKIEKVDSGWECYWQLGIAEHCPDCVSNSQKWNPLYIPG